ncbi:MAG: hypothetical protein EOO02_05885, partial [Chitinophagaceae bacterium]
MLKLRTILSACLFMTTTMLTAQDVNVQVDFSKNLGPMLMERMALGQGGLSEEPMLANRKTEIKALHPSIIRLFVSEYYEVLPQKGKYHFTTLDSMVNDILATGAKPFMSICLKPKLFFPKIDHDIVEPNDYKGWEEFVSNVVK